MASFCLRRAAGATRLLHAAHSGPSLPRSATIPLLRPLAAFPSLGGVGGPSGAAFISTSEKSKVVTTVDKIAGNPAAGGKSAAVQKEESLEEKEENWISFGYNLVDRDEDEWAHHLIMFCSITVLLCWGTFFFAYYPDFKNQAWAQREAYLELERRERCGLPLIDPDMLEAGKIDLPSEEELADFDIVI
jgi:NADH dehydrogenase (ubiquinone) 1 beta subcomplex subunit 11